MNNIFQIKLYILNAVMKHIWSNIDTDHIRSDWLSEDKY